MGLGNSIGVVTYLRYAAQAFIRAVSPFFFRVGLCSQRVLTFLGDVASCGASDVIEMTEMPQLRGLGTT